MIRYIKVLMLCSCLLFTGPLWAQTTSSAKQVLNMVNKERRNRGLKPVVGSSTLAQVANGHAKDMNYNKYFSHNSRNGDDLGDRLHDERARYRVAGENIARGHKTATSVMKGWMKSPGHKKNILNKRFRRLGVAKSGTYWVQVFSD